MARGGGSRTFSPPPARTSGLRAGPCPPSPYPPGSGARCRRMTESTWAPGPAWSCAAQPPRSARRDLQRGQLGRELVQRLHVVVPGVLDEQDPFALAERRDNLTRQSEHGGFVGGAVPDHECPTALGQRVHDVSQG